MDYFIQYTLNGVLMGLVYSVIALAFVQVYRASGIINLAQGGLVLVGGYLTWWFASRLGFGPWLGLLATLPIAFLLGILIERILLRPMVGQPVFSMIMVTVGLLVLIEGLTLFIWGPKMQSFPSLLAGPSVELGPLSFNRALLLGGVSALVVTAVIWLIMDRTTFGLKLTAVAEGHIIAQSMGISPQRAIAYSWALAMILSTWGAVLLMDGRSLDLHISDMGMRLLVIPLLSGLESVRGVIVGGLIVGVGEALSAAYLNPYTGGAASSLFPFMVMIIVLLIRPQGLFGWKIIERV